MVTNVSFGKARPFSAGNDPAILRRHLDRPSPTVIQLHPPASVLAIADRLEAAGFEAWCVGGAIRDALLGGTPLDWDLATTARPDQVQALFGRRRTIPVGIEYGTVSVLDDANVPHEITTFRRDVSTDGRHAVVEFGASLEDDLARRDLTINAIAYRPATRELRDPFSGRADLAAGIVRAVGDPDERMREDRLRALRAIRFAARYGFVIDPTTRAAIAASAPHLTRLSAERVRQELVKTMEQVACPARALGLWRDTGALTVLIPALAGVDEVQLGTLDRLALASAGGRNLPQRTANRLAALFMDCAATETRDVLQALRFSRHEISWANGIGERWAALGGLMAAALRSGAPIDDRTVRRWLAVLGRLQAGAFLRIASARWATQRASEQEAPSARSVRLLHRRMTSMRLTVPLAVPDLAVNGDDLRRLGIPAGPIYATLLQAMLERVLDDPARNTPEALLAEVPLLLAASGDRAGPVVHPLPES
jgi:tRNA nucleotidyltransferase (CCA-adding enzyme)